VIVTAIPYCPDGEGKSTLKGTDLGYAINETAKRLRPEDWLFVFDHDMFFTTRIWYRQIERHVREEPQAGFFTTMRYPASNLWSMPREIGPKQFDIRYHRSIGGLLAKQYAGQRQDVTDYKKLDPPTPTAGIFLFSKVVWTEVGGFKRGFKRIDHDFHRRVRATGRRIFLMRDVYLFHAKGL
jgi:GT2 family glycosyltransferase